MPMRILVPLDGSRFSDQAVSSAYQIGLLSRATVHLARVIRPGVQVSAEAAFSTNPTLNILREEAQGYLQQQAGRAPLGVATRTAVLHGPDSVAELLARYIATAGIDLVVMCTHARTGLGRLWTGSEADELVRTVKVPVLLLRPHKGESGPEVECWNARRILIPLDGSERAEAALEPAVELGWLTDARYTLLQVVRPPALETYPDAVSGQLDEHEIEHELQLAHDYLEGVADRLRLLGFRADTLVVSHCSIAHAIAQEVREQRADMIALGTHGRSGWSRLTLGSVTQDILHSAQLPVLVIRSVETEADINRSSLTAAAC
jgi:nucleotide-binding universal stress UspA family protein